MVWQQQKSHDTDYTYKLTSWNTICSQGPITMVEYEYSAWRGEGEIRLQVGFQSFKVISQTASWIW